MVAEDLAALQIYTVKDLIYYLPYRYDVQEIKPLSVFVNEDKVTIVGKVIHEPSHTFHGRKTSRLTFTVGVEKVAVRAVMFNRAFAKKQIHSGDMITLTGKWDAHRLQITVSFYKKGQAENRTKIQPMYSFKGNMTNRSEEHTSELQSRSHLVCRLLL